jgi:RIO kinase 1
LTKKHDGAANFMAAKKSDEDFTYLVHRPKPKWDDDEPDPEATTYLGATHGPDPVPDWVITSGDARQYELGALKSGKEAEVFIVERTFGDERNLLAAKRYRDGRQRGFRDASYRTGKEPRDGRTARAIKKKTDFGMAARAGVWAAAEFESLSRMYIAGVPVPYPVQLLDTEILLEYLGDEDEAAPRLAQYRPAKGELNSLRDQAVAILWAITGAGLVHADLSPYNVLVWEGRLYVIDAPQAAELTDVTRASQYNPMALEFLRRDCHNLLQWFERKRADVPDPDKLYSELVAAAFAPDPT